MTKQKIFDTVVAHLISMKQRSAENGSCLYRGPNGAKCAAGVLLPDSEYKPHYEGKVVFDVLYFEINYGDDELFLINDLQEVHDEPSNWLDDLGFVGHACLMDIARTHELEWKHDGL